MRVLILVALAVAFALVGGESWGTDPQPDPVPVEQAV